ncbi:unnamed protein product [Anisakis simplex]|uniref:SSD domain-containing protein n=1 Tax=Anisakis simplex TaxID=6269 RepID=A0A0M3K850_ANISI|nr:unnamed protein product [Anisakis simplex]
MDGAIASALALNHLIRLKDNFRPEILKDWDKQFRDQIFEYLYFGMSKFQMQHEVAEVERETDAGLYWWSYREFIEDVQSSFKKMHATLIFSGYILIFLCLLACLTTNAYQSKPVLGAIIGMIIIICCIVGFAVQFAGAASFNVVVFPVFFIISGIGLLILFSLESTWSKYSNAACDPLEKLSLIMSWDGPCAAISSLIIIIAFLIVGSSTANPYLQYVSFVLAAAIAILLIFTVLFFTVFLYMSGRHETMGLKWYQCLQPGDSHFAPRTIKDYNEVSISLLHDKLVEIKPTIAHLVASLISNHYVKCPIAFIFAIYLVFAVWGCKDFKLVTQYHLIEIAIKRVEIQIALYLGVLQWSSESRLYMQQYRDMFGKYEEYLELIFDEPIDYHDRARKQEILTFIDWPVVVSLQQNQLATRSVSWLKDFSRFESSTIYEINSVSCETSNDTFVPIVSLVFLKADNFKKYHSDIVFDKYQTQIIASKMYIELSTKGVEERLSLIDDLIAKAKSLGLPLTIKAPFAFSIQHDLQVLAHILSIVFNSNCINGFH